MYFESFSTVLYTFWILFYETLEPVKNLLENVDFRFSKQPVWLDSDRKSWFTFCGTWFQYRINFQSLCSNTWLRPASVPFRDQSGCRWWSTREFRFQRLCFDASHQFRPETEPRPSFTGLGDHSLQPLPLCFLHTHQLPVAPFSGAPAREPGFQHPYTVVNFLSDLTLELKHWEKREGHTFFFFFFNNRDSYQGPLHEHAGWTVTGGLAFGRIPCLV